jgi:ATP-dependent Clp protease ATP-binding subunit ClpA
MFERFSEGARDVVVRAQQEADTLGHNYLGTEHLLLALVEDDGAAGTALRSLGLSDADLRARTRSVLGETSRLDADALATLGIDLDRVRDRVEATFGPGALERTRAGKRFCGGRPFTPKAKKVLELSLREALQRGDRRVGSEHVLLGLLREPKGLAVKLLEQGGVGADAVRAAVLRELNCG